ncbi:hypothetical protein [Enterococcus mundtii]|nr:hypothetical protein [Enterococcus mundtii]
MPTTIYPNGIKVHCVWQDGTHMKEGEKTSAYADEVIDSIIAMYEL